MSAASFFVMTVTDSFGTPRVYSGRERQERQEGQEGAPAAMPGPQRQ